MKQKLEEGMIKSYYPWIVLLVLLVALMTVLALLRPIRRQCSASIPIMDKVANKVI